VLQVSRGQLEVAANEHPHFLALPCRRSRLSALASNREQLASAFASALPVFVRDFCITFSLF
jgi:hypothetical protein